MHVDWDDMMADSDNAPNADISMTVNEEALALQVEVNAEFVGWSSADDETPGYGMMYMIDFEYLDGSAMSVTEPGRCANRNQDAQGMSWEDHWVYAVTPDRGVDWNNGSYTDGRYWSLSTNEDGQCNDVKWTGLWSWYNLMNCTNYAGDQMYVEITENAEWVNMSGAVTVSLVSPLNLNSDTGLCIL